MKTFYVYKSFERSEPIAIIAPNVGKERMVNEVKRLHLEHGNITIRNALGGLISEIIDNKIIAYGQ